MPTVRVETKMVYEQELFQSLLESTLDYIYFKDRESRFVRVSRSKADGTLQTVRQTYRAAHPKLEPDQWPAHLANVEAFAHWLTGKTDFDTYPEEHARDAYNDEQEIIRTGRELVGKFEKAALPGGEHIWWLTTKLPWRDKDGNIIGTFGFSKDVTALKEAEAALDQERLLLRTLIDNLPDGIYAKDARGRKILANPADLKNLNCKTEAEAIGKTDFDLFPKEIAEKFYTDDQKVMQGEPVINREEYLLNGQAEKRWLLTSKLPLRNQKGKIIGLVGMGRDITERKRIEEELAHERMLLRTLIDNLPDCIYAKDAAGRKILANPADLKNLNCKTEAEAIGKTDFDFFPRDIAEKFFADDQRVIEGHPVINREEYFLDPEDRKHWLLTSKLPMRDQNGTIAGLVGIGRNITEQKEAEDALRESEARLRQFTTQLERSNRELQDFAYVASHDLQEPLRKIVVFGERLKEQSGEKLDAEARDFLERMQRAASRMQTLINDLLTFSRVTTKARPFTQVDLAEVAREVVNDLEGRIEQVKGRVEVGTLPVVEAESLQMRQLLQNLIGNALKFRRPEVTPVVKVAAQIITGPVPEEGAAGVAQKLCQLTVSDNGIGFEEKYLDRIFNVFQRLHTRNEYEGTGMGLAIARKIVLYHHGEITAKSKPGEGATFIATFPLIHPKEPSHPGENHA
ncbi:MAG TPA: PAS domain-containing protein [Verrucomicrobiae bacterium]|nr:PAS domain-containing protein [Verrucomicrobiae bacterium]